MKKLFFLFAFIGCMLVSCRPIRVDRATETVTGMVTDEKGIPLQGILIVKYYDQDLQEKARAFPDVYTNTEGEYILKDHSRYTANVKTKDFYLVATDTAGIYQRQIVKATMTYDFRPGDSDAVGSAEVNIVMVK